MNKTMIAAALGAALLTGGAARAGTVEVTLTGVQPRGGHILTALQTRADFMQPRATAGQMLAGDASGVVTFTLQNVPAGDYALSVLHDADDSRGMTLAADGKPAEGWGMPGAQALRAKPTFDQVHTVVGEGVTRITVPMVYPKS
jgi:uncharacterized protein (DUF2141 family)